MELDKSSLEILKYSNDPVLFTKEVLGLKCEWFHQEWLRAFDNNRFVVLLAPRGHGKTSIVGSYIVWRIIRDRNIRILIVTINQDKADDMMTFIKDCLTKNQKLISLFGDFKGDSFWTRDQITVKGRNIGRVPIKDPTLKVLGVNSRIISGHYDLIVLDDITDSDNSRTESRRRDLENWYNGDIVGTFIPESKVIDIGTRWHEDDIHNYFINKAGFKSFIYKALLNEKEINEMNEEPKVLWPERLPWDSEDPNVLTLKFIREHQGETYFQMQYQNNIIASGITKFKSQWLDEAISKYRKLNGVIPVNLKRYIGVDWGGEDERSDWGACTVIGVDEERGDIYILDSTRTHSSPNRQIQIMESLDEKWHSTRIGMDAAAQQKFIVSDVAKRNPNLPIVPIKSSRVSDKETRADRLSILFETHRVYLNPNLEHLIDELRIYPRGKHDDCIDSLSFALEVSQEKNLIDWGKVPSSIRTKRQYEMSKV